MSEFGSGRSVNSVAPLKAGSLRGPGARRVLTRCFQIKTGFSHQLSFHRRLANGSEAFKAGFCNGLKTVS